MELMLHLMAADAEFPPYQPDPGARWCADWSATLVPRS